MSLYKVNAKLAVDARRVVAVWAEQVTASVKVVIALDTGLEVIAEWFQEGDPSLNAKEAQEFLEGLVLELNWDLSV